MSDALDKRSEEGLDQAVEKAFEAGEKDVYEYEGKKYTAHAAATLFPLVKGEDFEALVASLAENGLRNPILLLGDKIVDGRNRFRAALKAGVKIIFKQVDLKEDICRLAMDMNIHRRDLGTNKKVLVASPAAADVAADRAAAARGAWLVRRGPRAVWMPTPRGSRPRPQRRLPVRRRRCLRIPLRVRPLPPVSRRRRPRPQRAGSFRVWRSRRLRWRAGRRRRRPPGCRVRRLTASIRS